MHASATAHDIDCLSGLYMCHVVHDNCRTAAHWTLCCCAVRFCYHSCSRKTITIVHHKLVKITTPNEWKFYKTKASSAVWTGQDKLKNTELLILILY